MMISNHDKKGQSVIEIGRCDGFRLNSARPSKVAAPSREERDGEMLSGRLAPRLVTPDLSRGEGQRQEGR